MRRIRNERDAFAQLADSVPGPDRQSREAMHEELERELEQIAREYELDRRRQRYSGQAWIDAVLLVAFGAVAVCLGVAVLLIGRT